MRILEKFLKKLKMNLKNALINLGTIKNKFNKKYKKTSKTNKLNKIQQNDTFYKIFLIIILKY